jgi:hypothetical protein
MSHSKRRTSDSRQHRFTPTFNPAARVAAGHTRSRDGAGGLVGEVWERTVATDQPSSPVGRRVDETSAEAAIVSWRMGNAGVCLLRLGQSDHAVAMLTEGIAQLDESFVALRRLVNLVRKRPIRRIVARTWPCQGQARRRKSLNERRPDLGCS